MSAILQLIVGAFLRELFAALASYVTSRQNAADTKALGRAEAERDAAMEAALRAEAMNGVAMPDDQETVKRLREGSA